MYAVYTMYVHMCMRVFVCARALRSGSNSYGGVAIALLLLFHRTEDRNDRPCNHHGSYSPKGKLQLYNTYTVMRNAACRHMAITSSVVKGAIRVAAIHRG